MPRRNEFDLHRALPLVRALPFGSIWARGRTKGIAQEWKQPLTAGQSHSLPSGGEADAKLAHDFKGEADAKLAMTFKGKDGAEVAHDS